MPLQVEIYVYVALLPKVNFECYTITCEPSYSGCCRTDLLFSPEIFVKNTQIALVIPLRFIENQF